MPVVGNRGDPRSGVWGETEAREDLVRVSGDLWAASATGSTSRSVPVAWAPWEQQMWTGLQGSKTLQSKVSTSCLNLIFVDFPEGEWVVTFQQEGQWARGTWTMDHWLHQPLESPTPASCRYLPGKGTSVAGGRGKTKNDPNYTYGFQSWFPLMDFAHSFLLTLLQQLFLRSWRYDPQSGGTFIHSLSSLSNGWILHNF